MRHSFAVLLTSTLAVTGCTTGPAQSTPADHPANPDAAPMPLSDRSGAGATAAPATTPMPKDGL